MRAEPERSGVAQVLVLFGPAVLLLSTVLLPAVVILLAVSGYQYTGSNVLRIFTFQAYAAFFTDPFYFDVVLRGIVLALLSTCICLLLGYPAAYALTKLKHPKLALIAYILIFSPLLTSIVVRAYGWLVILSGTGLVNWVLIELKLVDGPVRFIFNATGVVIALVHYLLPFTVFPILSVLLRMDGSLRDAAADLGANRVQAFVRITLPLSFPGVLVAAQLTFVLAINAFVTPQLIGGGRVLVLPQLIYQNITTLNWPLAAVQAIVLVGLVAGVMFASRLALRRARWIASGRFA